MRQGVMVVGGSLVHFAGRARGFGVRDRGLGRRRNSRSQQQYKGEINAFHREPSASLNHSDWMPNRWWWVLLNHCKPSREELAKKPVAEPGEAMIRSTGTTRIGRSRNQPVAGKNC